MTYPKIRLCFFITFFITSLFFSPCHIYAADKKQKSPQKNPETKTGHIVSNETWSGNIQVSGDVIIPEEVTVNIKPGTIITFANGHSDYEHEAPIAKHVIDKKCNIIVDGTLTAIGAKKNEIIFGAEKESDSVHDSWGGIIFTGNSQSILKECKIKNAVFGIAIINKNCLKIEHSVIENCSIGIYNTGTSKANITTTLINKCGTGIEVTGEAASAISYNYILGNDWGVSYTNSSTPLIFNNSISKNELGISGYSDGMTEIRDNEITENKIGIRCLSRYSTLKNNKVTKNLVGLEYEAVSMPKLDKNTFSKNKVNMKEK